MTLLSICQDAADELNLPQPSVVAASSLDDDKKLLRMANKVGNRLMKAYAWQVLRKETTFTATAGEAQASILAADFDRFVPETFWDRTNIKLISGPIPAAQWQGLKATAYSGYPQKFIYRGDSVSIIPAMSGGESCAFEYVSSYWCQSSGGSGQTAWAADTDTGIIDEELITYGVIYEWLSSEGQAWQKAAADYLERFNMLIGNDQPSAGVMVAGDIFGGGRHYAGTPPVNAPGLIL